MPGDGRTKVAVLGGGAGALAAAFELTATEELRARFDVTVHQLGWRCGGKGASGRNMARNARIEEHGLHLWFGFYDNAFAVMRDTYAELGRTPGEDPLATVDEAFHPCDSVVLYEQFRERWIGRSFTFPQNGHEPGVASETTFWSVIEAVLGELRAHWHIHEPRVRLLGGDADRAARLDAAHGLARDRRAVDAPHDDPALDELLRLLREAGGVIIALGLGSDDDHFRMLAMSMDMVSAALTGILADDLLRKGLGAANDEDLKVWLARHGAHRQTLDNAPFIRGFYDLIFGFEEGDWTRPNVAAGAALSAMIRIVFDYKKAVLFKMQAGMGDVVFAPMYEVLRRRGVTFAFFHAVSALHPSQDGASVAAIDVIPQATVAAGEGAYEPLVPVHGLPCWPSTPDLSQLAEGDRLQGVDLEHDVNPLGHRPVTLRAGQDFDAVVLGISLGALDTICAPLVRAQPGAPLSGAIAHGRSVMTQAFQVWTTEGATDGLGWEYGADGLASSFIEPVDTYCDMTHLVAHEDWPAAAAPKSVAYFCGVLPDAAAATQEAADAAALQGAVDLLGRIEPLWPSACPRPGGFRWDVLLDGTNAKGRARIRSQYWRGNFQPSERYVLTPAGSVRHRVHPGDTGFANLVAAGDWTRNDIDGGSVEGAVTSGIRAARALTQDDRPPLGVTGWMAARGDP